MFGYNEPFKTDAESMTMGEMASHSLTFDFNEQVSMFKSNAEHFQTDH